MLKFYWFVVKLPTFIIIINKKFIIKTNDQAYICNL